MPPSKHHNLQFIPKLRATFEEKFNNPDSYHTLDKKGPPNFFISSQPFLKELQIRRLLKDPSRTDTVINDLEELVSPRTDHESC